MSRCRWFQWDHGPYRVGTKYRKNTDHNKKQKIDTAWLIEQDNIKRQSRGGRCAFCCQPESKKFYQKQNNKKLRTYVKTKMYNEDYDAIPVGAQHSKWIFRNQYDWS